MDLLSFIKREIVNKAYRYGLVLTPEALEYLVFSVKDVDNILRDLSKKGIVTVRLEDLLGEPETSEEEKVETDVEPVAPEVDTVPRECSNRIRVRLYVDPDEIYPSSWEREQEKMLRERLEFLSGLILSKGRVSFTEYERALRSEEERYIKALILKVDTTATGKTVLYVENGEETATVISPGVKGIDRKLAYIDEDVVVALGVRSREGSLILTDVVYPGSFGHYPPAEECSYRLLVVPDVYSKDISKLPFGEVDGVAFLSNIVHVYRSENPMKDYRDFDSFVHSLEKDVFIVPGPYDAVRSVPPRPPLDTDLLPNTSGRDRAYVLGSPAVVRINATTVLFYDGEYYRARAKPLEAMVFTRLVQPPTGSFPYLSSRDYSLLRKVPDMVLSPVGGKPKHVGDVLVVPATGPYIVELSSGKVIPLEA